MIEGRNLKLILLLSWCSLIFAFSHLTATELPAPLDLYELQTDHSLSTDLFIAFLNWDKLHHATAYAVMAILAWRFFSHYQSSPFQLIAISFIFCSLYGLSDEWHQSFILGRESDSLDWLADCTGALLILSFISSKTIEKELVTS